MPTPHIEASADQIADTILLPGDPLRAKAIADEYLQDAVQFNSVRNILGFTGTYKGKKISVMGTGMGMPSVGIYVTELVDRYGVEKLFRIGTIGAMQEEMKIGDIVIAQGACTDSSFSRQYELPGSFSAISDFELLLDAVTTSAMMDLDEEHSLYVGNILSTDVFYSNNWKKWAKMGVLGTEMETFALYCIAANKGVKALSICTVSDLLPSGLAALPQERQDGFMSMAELALNVAVA